MNKILSSSLFFKIIYPQIQTIKLIPKTYIACSLVVFLLSIFQFYSVGIIFGIITMLPFIAYVICPYFINKEIFQYKNKILYSKYKTEITPKHFVNLLNILNKNNFEVSGFIYKSDKIYAYIAIWCLFQKHILSKCYSDKEYIELYDYSNAIKNNVIDLEWSDFDFKKIKLYFKHKQEFDEFNFLLSMEILKC